MSDHIDEATLPEQLVERVLSRLGLTDAPARDLAGLNQLFAAVSGSVPNDNIQKRIWLTGDRTTPVTGGDPNQFFHNWLDHGTGGTCWAINGAMATLAASVGFIATRIAGSMLVESSAMGANHGSVIVTVDGIDYLIDAQIAAFEALPLIVGTQSEVGMPFHTISATPRGNEFDIRFWAGHRRNVAITFRREAEHDPVDHAFFVRHYARSAASDEYSPFNRHLYICRHFADRILSIRRGRRVAVDADGRLTSTAVTDEERCRVLVEELGISEEAAQAAPPDDVGNGSPP